MIQKPRGTLDLLPESTPLWRKVEQACFAVSRRFGYEEIRVPTFERSELYHRSVGEGTDVVQKETYDFSDKDGRAITLRPEGTAGVSRAVIENSLYAGVMPLKLSYLLSCFRYELPQAGRSREFYQFGVECFGAARSACDAEVILLADGIFKELGLSPRLEINSIGCPECRARYLEALKEYFSACRDQLCETCRGRLEKNALRILDCKNESCKAISKDAPLITDYLCADCKTQFDEVKELLDAQNLVYTVNPRIVRGLDYYRGLVFEFIDESIGAQSTLCGGGRYDGLIRSLDGPDLPGIGFAMGLTRIILCLEQKGEPVPAQKPDLYLASTDPESAKAAFTLAQALRERGLCATSDLVGRSVKSQMKYADKSGAGYVIVLGDEELQTKRARLRSLRDGTEQVVDIEDPDALKKRIQEGN